MVLTAQFGSNAVNVGVRPRYNPLKPSVLIIFCRLVIMTLPGYPKFDKYQKQMHKRRKQTILARTPKIYVNSTLLGVFTHSISFYYYFDTSSVEGVPSIHSQSQPQIKKEGCIRWRTTSIKIIGFYTINSKTKSK